MRTTPHMGSHPATSMHPSSFFLFLFFVFFFFFFFFFVADCSSYEVVPGKELSGKRVAEYRKLSVEQRRQLFETYHTAPPAAMKRLTPQKTFNSRCHAMGDNTPIMLFVGAPLSTVSGSFGDDAALASRVVYCATMGGSWDGSQNLLGVCFNNAVAYEASKKVFATGFFPNGRAVLVPTEACKMGPFSLHADEAQKSEQEEKDPKMPRYAAIEQFPCAPREGFFSAQPSAGERLRTVLVDIVRQWGVMKQNKTQPLFDVAICLPITTLVAHGAVVTAAVHFGKNKYAKGSPFEDMGMTMRNFECTLKEGDVFDEPDHLPASVDSVPGMLAADAPFPGNSLYAVERVFRPEMTRAFEDLVRQCVLQSSSIGK